MRLLHTGSVVLVFVTLTFFSGGVASQNAEEGGVVAPAPSVPVPDLLTADWWRFFSDAGEKLDSRVEEFEARLDDIVLSLDKVGEPFDTIRRLALEIGGILGQYQSATARTSRPLPPMDVGQQSYSIKGYLALVSRQRDRSFELEIESDELERETEALSNADKDIKNLLAQYLEMGIGVPERLQRGLEIIRARLLWATASEDLRVGKGRVEQLRTRSAQLDATVEEAQERLVMSAEDLAFWRSRQTEASQEAARLEAAALATRLDGTIFPDDDRGSAQKRVHTQTVLNLETKALIHRLQVRQAALALAIGEHLMATTDVSAAALRAARNELEDTVKQTAGSVTTLQESTRRERAAAERMLTESTDQRTGVEEVHRTRILRADETAQSANRIERDLVQARALMQVASRQLVETEGQTADLIARAEEQLILAWATVRSWTTFSLFTLNDTPVTLLGLFRFSIILVIAWWMSRLVRRGLERLMSRRDTMNQASIYTLNRLFHYVILVLGFLVAASSIGIDFTKFALIASAFGVGLGFGLQAIFSNFVAGLIILFERSLKVGDFVEVESGVTGEVREINIRSTLVTTNDNIDMLLPNSEFVNGRVINWTLREAYRRVRIPFGVAYGTDKELVKKAALAAADDVSFTLRGVENRAPQVWLVEFGDSSLNFELVAWLTPEAVKRPATVHAAYCWAIETELGRNNIEIPFPQRDLHVRSWFGEKQASVTVQAHSEAA